MGKTLIAEVSDASDVSLACCAPLGAPDISDDEAEATAAAFKALSDPHRVRIVNCIARAGALCVCELPGVLGVTQPTVSFHLKKLVAAGLLRREQRGTWAYYSIDEAAAARLAWIVNLTTDKERP
ncbi:MAG TPA: metalloregulator ArsR/SmtB family transcription factor [Actinomycetota bacterium]|nr:metalloregulator ArsR/SmtB family transcription factor [Actinomycetota bacterium]